MVVCWCCHWVSGARSALASSVHDGGPVHAGSQAGDRPDWRPWLLALLVVVPMLVTVLVAITVILSVSGLLKSFYLPPP